MKQVVTSDRKHRLFDFVVLAGGSVLGQMIAFLFAPVISRVYTVEEMGFYTLVLTAAGMFESAICLRYDMIIVSEKDDSKVAVLIRICVKIAILTSILISLLYTIYIYISHQCEIRNLWVFAFNIPILFCYALILVANAFNNRNQEYKRLSLASISQGGVHNISSVLFGLLGFGSVGLVLGRLFGYIANYLISVRFKIFGISSKTKNNAERQQYKEILYENKKQAIYSTPAVIISSVAYSIINIFIMRLFGESTLGLYSYSYRLLGIPLTVISANISRMFFKEAAVEYNMNGNMRKPFIRLVLPLTIVAIIMYFGFKLFAPDVFSILLGDKWREAGVYVQILAPMFSIRLVSNSFVNVTTITKKQVVSFIIQITYLVVTIGIYIYSYINKATIYEFLNLMNIMFCIIYTVYFIILAFMCIKQSEVNNENTRKD